MKIIDKINRKNGSANLKARTRDPENKSLSLSVYLISRNTHLAFPLKCLMSISGHAYLCSIVPSMAASQPSIQPRTAWPFMLSVILL